jgi:GNAT superfamily N-acetyltransferase
MAFATDEHYSGFLLADWDSMRSYLAEVITAPSSAILVSDGAAKFETITGMAGVQVQPHPMSGETVANELFWYVLPRHRDGTGRQLMKAVETWARENNAAKLQMTAPDDRISRLYERYGFQRVETTYQKALT